MSDLDSPPEAAAKSGSSQSSFAIESAEGLPIRGTFTLPRNARAYVIIVHGFKGFREWGFFPWVSEQFARHHIASVRFDMSRNGIGDRPDEFDRLDLFENDTYSTQLSDLRSVIGYAEAHPELRHLPLFLLGHSRGGAAVILTAAATPSVRGIVTWSSIASVDRWNDEAKRKWRDEGFIDATNSRTGQAMRVSTKLLDDCETNSEALDIERAVGALQRPALIVHGVRDESVPVEEGKRIAAAGQTVSLLLIGNAGHTYGAIHPLVTVPDELQLAFNISERFVRTYT
ncbi:MAG: alpha/beta fold hydrolase [Acidobacteriota bacterium]